MNSLETRLAPFLDQVPPGREDEARRAFASLKLALHQGTIRAAERDADGTWRVNGWVKRGILLGFRLGVLVDAGTAGPMRFFDKDSFGVRATTIDEGIRIVPGGTAVREGSYLARGVIVVPPAYVNVGAYVDEGTLIDSHALVGSCAQIGKRVHLSAAAQIGGVLEPAGAMPVIIEDDVLVGGNCGVYEGTIVRQRAVLAPGVLLTGGTAVVDLVHDRILRREGDSPLEIPEGAVVVPGSRSVTHGSGQARGISLYAPVIVKYRDERTDAAVQLEDLIR
ncbi:MAG: 2,3,4,5-tetrahydropyridine-2,6-dicarboxylate N-succinyltransferase [Gemmatimonadales bacterium]|nr:2,3,4,5-tetrahydropyridine-2,6-dicarboxylate N-succinyltransferase [Gemmatimonadota bacterium]MBP6444853.1 2,3,4,5-tetrahydropyridine-2,6-dicarboxylate N-succinyltransferase [Gemmatimonadales bacterium]MBP6572707.1 2,3,4,5-tetrahydropyridine-2,6-dicarboxylate N-succinyltransferase [Gemmatimonadales bacterium]MBP9898290.1 2,3,4,5-tetrahydropyridine-2,6-dicarboxylate N-succinyltransferase [Gemmatimonadales bacterium]